MNLCTSTNGLNAMGIIIQKKKEQRVKKKVHKNVERK